MIRMTSINLLLSATQRRQRRRRQCQAVWLFAAMTAFGAALIAERFVGVQIEHQQDRRNAMQRALDAPRRAHAALAVQAEQWSARAALAQKIAASAAPWATLLADLSARRPPALRLTSIRETGRVLHLTGETYRQDTILQYQRQLDALHWVAASSLVEMRGVRHGGRATDDGAAPPIKTFEMRLTLAAPTSMPLLRGAP